jgi:DNA processing protein
VVAGITDATIIVESGSKGGSIITAEIAGSYNRDVFAVPGRTIDSKSAGCNELIRNNKAVLLQDPQQFVEMMGWSEKEKREPLLQKQLFIDLSPEEQRVVELLRKHEYVSIDELNFQTGISSSAIAAALLNLEMKGLLKALPGKRFRLTE